MLKQRILTALWLLPLMLVMLFWAGDAVWALFTALIALPALWEFARLGRFDARLMRNYLTASAVLMFAAYGGGWHLPQAAWLAVLIFWFAVVPWRLRRQPRLRSTEETWVTGWLLVLPFWFGLNELRAQQGALALLAVMGLVWVADVFAYFVGKAWGKTKIAPHISPGKSWEGAIGGAVCVLVYITLVRAAGWPGFDTGWLTAALVALVLTAVSVCGDLLESLFKRQAGVKDSSNLLPGHGGVFDRVDSLIAVVSVYAAIAALCL
ncbi:phosphatidate cytidylyltransferase [Neisseria leonii]|uniref:Phosphatidate cytidylyltransferase n=1 Tax=Neisseria leonii TaxID=2995413 RepID=A0A9X4IEE3_9NEIS|nr:phosphatidate cytidylyltransferase [Neisseria sp. 51.81]MDD9328033.1 phosphatidate cytidylyltransferase [Neisseria sp. 51.81]